ncbi:MULTISPECIES: sensor domain-containing protein [unclassified Mycobacterium]|uniref:sensor domain-containing protein n=1 Tax=Mycobacterium sp. DL99 TaxID=2528957 RepID=UPI0010816CFE|nr:sensor domain-containing protein [Mycobacterium sp. DL99]
MRTTALNALCAATLLTVSACHSQGPSTVGATPSASPVHAASVTATPVDTTTAPTDPATLTLSVDALNSVVQQANPGAAEFDALDPAETTPRVPDPGPMAVCDAVNTLYFAAGTPATTKYVSQWAGAPGQHYVSQTIALYDTAAAASQKFGQLTAGIPACAKASAGEGIPFTVTPGEAGSDVARFTEKRKPNPSLSGGSSGDASEYRLAGSAIVGVSSSESPAVVAAVADKLVSKLG